MNLKHGGYGTPEYESWAHSKARCFNPSNRAFVDYGGRGVTMCARWSESFGNFLADMGPRPSIQHTLDRFPNGAGNYEPGNCRWATKSEQNRNKRDNVNITVNGETKPLVEWCRITGISRSTVDRRRKQGIKGAALLTPVIKLKCECGRCETCYHRNYRRRKRTMYQAHYRGESVLDGREVCGMSRWLSSGVLTAHTAPFSGGGQ